MFGIYYQNSTTVLPTMTLQRVYFSITAETFFMHSISEEVYRPSNTIYLVGKLFPHWKTRYENGNIECRIYEGQWAKAPSGFRVKSSINSENTDELYVYKSKWLVRPVEGDAVDSESKDVPTETAELHQPNPVYTIQGETTDTNIDDAPVEPPIYSSRYKRRRIHIVSEMMVLWEWIRIWFNVYMLDEPLRLYKYNHRGERSRIQYVFTKDECSELYTQLFYDGSRPYEWFSKILVECMSIRWNRFVVFEEWVQDTSDEPTLEYVIPSNTGKRIAYNTYKKARWVSKRIGRGVIRRMDRGQYYPIRMLYTGFDDDTSEPSHTLNDDSRLWFDSQKDAFVTVWINKKGDEITMSCVSPSSELVQWKKEFDYFLSQWFPIITK
jgi:hypothetical protein